MRDPTRANPCKPVQALWTSQNRFNQGIDFTYNFDAPI
jgi:hypothetical protein